MTASPMSNRVSTLACPDFTRDLDITSEELVSLLELAADVKKNPRRYSETLKGKYMAMLFEKPSLRTRMTFELAAKQLGGDAIFSAGVIGEREPIRDIARNLDRWTDCIVARVFSHQTVLDLAQWSAVPVVNALCDRFHPCQALADVQTVHERFGHWEGLTMTYVGDGNNVAHSLMQTCVRLGMHFRIACPPGYEPEAGILAETRQIAVPQKLEVIVTNDPHAAAKGAEIIYTDVWASMGQESQAVERRGIFQPYQVNDQLMGEARANAIFMHCLPAKRNQEVTESVMESKQSVVFDQAENRLHAQKALLLMLLGRS